jgi:putative redox protein
MPVKVRVEWAGELKFTAENENGVSTVMDATDAGDRLAGITPMELLLMALGGCTGIDIVMILKKQRQKLTSLTLHVTGHRRSEPPRYYEQIHVEYVLKGSNLDEKKVQRAIQLSEEKYCSVSAALKERARITSSYKIEQ